LFLNEFNQIIFRITFRAGYGRAENGLQKINFDTMHNTIRK